MESVVACFVKGALHDKEGSKVWSRLPLQEDRCTRTALGLCSHVSCVAHHQLVKSGHAFIRAADSLFVWGVHAASPVQNLRQTLPGWGHSIVIGTLW